MSAALFCPSSRSPLHTPEDAELPAHSPTHKRLLAASPGALAAATATSIALLGWALDQPVLGIVAGVGAVALSTVASLLI